MKRNIYILSALLAGAVGLTGCSDFLDKQSAAYDSDGFYRTDAGLDEGVTGAYALVPFNLNWDVPPTMVQDVYSPYALQDQENTTIGAGGGLTPDQSYVNSYWAGHYNIVARANSVIDGAKTDRSDMSDMYKARLAEVKFIRAYAYYNLMTTFGDVPFFTSSVTPDQYGAGRTDKKEITDYIVAELNEIAESGDLAWKTANRGRTDRAAVYALISRYCLFAGSLDFGGEGREYFKKAAAAASEAMAHRHLAGKFNDLFTLAGQEKADVLDEILWEIPYSTAGSRKVHRTRFGHTSRTVGGSSVRFPSSLLACTFECKDGKRIDESPLYDPKKPSANRDPRFRETLLCHGDTMQYTLSGNKAVLNVYDSKTRMFPNPRKPNEWYSGNNLDVSGVGASFAKPGNGLLWNKYNTDLTEGFSESSIDIIIMRMAEVYLTYAEAKIELGEMDESVYEAINAVRRRAGMPDFDNARKGNQDLMRQIVRRERKVELAMEGVVFTDFRRWQIGDILNEHPIYGQPIDEIRYEGLTAADVPNFKTTQRHDINDVANFEHFKNKLTARDLQRHWEPRFQWWPIPRADLDRDPNLTNPEGY